MQNDLTLKVKTNLKSFRHKSYAKCLEAFNFVGSRYILFQFTR